MAAIKAKGGVYDKTNSDAESLAFNNVKLGHRTTAAFLVSFVNGKAYRADYIFQPDVEAQVISDYKNLVNDIVGFYGVGYVTQNYNYPYKEGDDNTLLGLSAGKINFHTTWTDVNKNSIEVNITTDMVVTYNNDALSKESSLHQKAKDSSDF